MSNQEMTDEQKIEKSLANKFQSINEINYELIRIMNTLIQFQKLCSYMNNDMKISYPYLNVDEHYIKNNARSKDEDWWGHLSGALNLEFDKNLDINDKLYLLRTLSFEMVNHLVDKLEVLDGYIDKVEL